jgi:23S rRNA (guanosine2251-2'-O)-methyltransferase
VPGEKLDRITRKNHQGIIAYISAVEYANIEELMPLLFETGKTPLILILDGITDVRNFGAIARSAECAGVHAIIIPEKGAAQVNADAVKTSAGALLRIPICRVRRLSESLKFLKNSGLQVLAATEKGADYYYKVDMTLPTAIIMGAEDTGVYVENLKLADKNIKIPILGEIESLNVSVAASLIIYEAVRQRLGN